MSTKLSISAASKKVRKGRETLRNMMNKGELSFEINAKGHRVLELSELQRVFPDRLKMNDEKTSLQEGKTSDGNNQDMQFLLDEIRASAGRERAQAEARIARIEKDFDDAKVSYEKSLRLIEDLTSKADLIAAEKKDLEERHRLQVKEAAKTAAAEAVKAWQEEERQRRAARRQEELASRKTRTLFQRMLGVG